MDWYCILIAAFLPYLRAVIAKSRMRLKENHAPREHVAQLTGFRARANWAQENGYEAFPLFASAVIAAHVTQVPAESITLWAWVFVAARVVYIIAYLVDQPYIRSAVWGAGQCCSAYLLILAAMQG